MVTTPTRFAGFPPEMITFFRGLKRNNRREWFQPRKELFDSHVRTPMLELAAALNGELQQFAPEYCTEPKKAVFRIYRDTRFSADKTPYKTQIAASFGRRGSSAGGFYLSISHEEVAVGGGVWHPAPDEMLAVRNHIATNYGELRAILADRKVKKLLGELKGDQLTRVPKGFDCAHPAADLIKKKDWFLYATLDPAVAVTPQLHKELIIRFRALVPFLEYLNAPFVARKPATDLLADRW